MTEPISGTVRGITNTVHLSLDGKHIIDFLLVLIELFCQL